MRSIKEMMEEMGFNKEAPLESQKAFIKHLISAANAADNRQKRTQPLAQPMSQTKASADKIKVKTKLDENQLSFEIPEDKRVS